jgi:hypothetical protein
MHCVTKIISGGQTGADQAGLWAARDLGLLTGGWMPRGFLTERGHDPELAAMFGMTAHNSATNKERTLANIMSSDGTLIFGDDGQPGSALTRILCIERKKPLRIVCWDCTDGFIDHWNTEQKRIDYVSMWLERHQIATLNIAGNRESRAPGIFAACRQFLVSVLQV